jgi:hypothetical protein
LRAQAGDLAAFEQLLILIHAPLRKYVSNLAGVSPAGPSLVPPTPATARAERFSGVDLSHRHGPRVRIPEEG